MAFRLHYKRGFETFTSSMNILWKSLIWSLHSDSIWAVMIVWRLWGTTSRSVLCCIVYHNCTHLYAHWITHMIRSYKWTRAKCVLLHFLLTRASLLVIEVVTLCCLVIISTSAMDCLERLVTKMTCYVMNGTLNSAHLLAELYCIVFYQFCCRSDNNCVYIKWDFFSG